MHYIKLICENLTTNLVTLFSQVFAALQLWSNILVRKLEQ
jgi:hypothetical protein